MEDIKHRFQIAPDSWPSIDHGQKGTAQQVSQEEDGVIGRHEPYLNKTIAQTDAAYSSPIYKALLYLSVGASFHNKGLSTLQVS